MIGQNNLKETLKTQVLPVFTIILGSKGSGRKTLLKECFKVNTIWLDECKVDNIRDMIDSAYKYHNMLFIIPDGDNMSAASKNALLKVVEEPPNNNRFIMTLEDKSNTLDTILSRAVVYSMDLYSHEELKEYISQYYELTSPQEEKDICLMVCSTPGEIDLLMSMRPMEFYEYVQLVFENIGKVSGTNALKIGNRIAFKEDSEGFDLKLFFTLFEKLCLTEYMNTNNLNYIQLLKLTSNALQDLKIKGINKSALFDMWVLNVRRVLL